MPKPDENTSKRPGGGHGGCRPCHDGRQQARPSSTGESSGGEKTKLEAGSADESSPKGPGDSTKAKVRGRDQTSVAADAGLTSSKPLATGWSGRVRQTGALRRSSLSC